MQGIIYIFIALIGVGIGAAAYFGLTFSVIETLLAAVLAIAVALIVFERSLRLRGEARLQRTLEDLSRLLSTNAQAGQVLSQRLNALADENIGTRLDALEADMSVLGTVVRQVAEAVADLEEGKSSAKAGGGRGGDEDDELFGGERRAPRGAEPVIPAELLRDAIGDDRLVFHIAPLIGLPQRQVHGYDLTPRLMLEDGEIADSVDFMPRPGSADALIRRIERLGLDEAVTVARRARTGGEPMTLFVPVSRATLGDENACGQMMALLDANRALHDVLILTLNEGAWTQMSRPERERARQMAKSGVGFAVTGLTSLRRDFDEMAGDGVRQVRVSADRFINATESLTDFHPSDIAAYIARYEIELVVSDIRSEQQVMSLIEDGVRLATGPHIAPPGPIRPDLLVRKTPLQKGAPEPRIDVTERRAGS